jgi:hypothetical protein
LGPDLASGEKVPTDWGPPGLETTSPPVNKVWLTLVAVCLVAVIGVPWCQENVGYIDLMSGDRGCGAAPPEIRIWAFHHHTRSAEELVNLQRWTARHRGRVNNRYGAFCDTPLHFAARFGREDLADTLIAAGADVEAQNELHERPLHLSATYGQPAVVKRLLAGGADVEARGPAGKTPLHAAALGLGGQSNIDGRIEVARLLLAAGASVNARQPGSGFTPLRYATSFESRNTAMADLLFAHGAEPPDAAERTSAPATRER